MSEEQTKNVEEPLPEEGAGAASEETPAEEPLVEVRTTLTEEKMLAFNKSQAIKLMWVPFALTALIACLGIFYAVKMGERIYGITMCVIGALLPVLYFWLTDHLMKKSIKNSPVLSGHPVQVFAFSEDAARMHEESAVTPSSDTQFAYTAFIRAEEKKAAYYLFIGKAQAYILDADGFTRGTREELSALLTQKLGERFKPLKRSK